MKRVQTQPSSSAVVAKRTKKMPLPKKITYEEFQASCRPQAYSLRPSLMYYIWQQIINDPSKANLYLKFIQTCKIFYLKTPMWIYTGIWVDEDKCYEISEDRQGILGRGKRFDFDECAAFPKIWITGNLLILSSSKFYASKLISKINGCYCKRLELGKQTLTEEEFLFLSPEVTDFHLGDTTVRRKDGTRLSPTQIFALLPKITKFNYSFTSHSYPNVMEEFLQIPHFKNLVDVSWFSCPQSLNIDLWFNFIKENKKTKFKIVYYGYLTETYTRRLQEICDEITTTPNLDFAPPYIRFPKQRDQSHVSLYNLYDPPQNRYYQVLL